MIYGLLPWKEKNSSIQELTESIKKEQIHFPNTVDVPEKLKNLIKKMLVIDEEERISIV